MTPSQANALLPLAVLGIPGNAPLAIHEYLNESYIPFWAVEWRDKKLRSWREIKRFNSRADAKKLYHELEATRA